MNVGFCSRNVEYCDVIRLSARLTFWLINSDLSINLANRFHLFLVREYYRFV
nr:MAG TPA: protein of unknown function (DUF5330) [Caudoviricetes sp.]